MDLKNSCRITDLPLTMCKVIQTVQLFLKSVRIKLKTDAIKICPIRCENCRISVRPNFRTFFLLVKDFGENL